MLREATVHAMDWCEKTMSMIREKQYEACELRLSGGSNVGLFSSQATDADAQALLEGSYYASEQTATTALATLEDLRAQVLTRLPLEAMYLSQAESELLERLLISEGRLTSSNWDAIDAAEALVSRLWCVFVDEGDNWTLELPEPLREPLLAAIHQLEKQDARTRCFRYDATLHGLLYIAGFLHSSQPVDFFLRDVIKRDDELARSIAYRYLKATFEYMDDLGGEVILLHPGLADPYRLLRRLGSQEVFALQLTQEMIAGGMNGIFPEEVPLHEAMRGALLGSLRPECDVDESAEDLRMLAKQGVPLPEMEAVMASMLCVLPNDAMRYALRRLYESTPRWLGLKASLQN